MLCAQVLVVLGAQPTQDLEKSKIALFEKRQLKSADLNSVFGLDEKSRGRQNFALQCVDSYRSSFYDLGDPLYVMVCHQYGVYFLAQSFSRPKPHFQFCDPKTQILKSPQLLHSPTAVVIK